MPVNTNSLARDRMGDFWKYVDPLLGGTPAMRALTTQALPKEEGEESPAYNARLKRSWLFNAYRDTVRKLTSRPFSKPVTVTGEDLDERIEMMRKNIDRRGTKLTTYLARQFFHAGAYGIGFGFCDMPKQAKDEKGNPINLSVADTRKGVNGPYFTFIHPRDFIGVEFTEDVFGTVHLKTARWWESSISTDNFTQKEVKKVRVIYAPELDNRGNYSGEGKWELWAPTGDGGKEDSKYEIEAYGTHQYPGIPLEPLYTGECGHFEAEPPLMDLAYLNWAHWQSDSDQRNITHFIRLAILFGSGFDKKTIQTGITVATNVSTLTSNDKANLKFVEHSGKGIEAGAKDLASLEEKMLVHGMAPYVTDVGNITATGRAIDEANSLSSVQQWCRNTEDFAKRMFGHAAKWLDIELPDDFSVQLQAMQGLGLGKSEDYQALIAIRSLRLITKEVFLEEVQRRGLLNEDIDIEAMLAELDSEAPVDIES
jgi:hypothetical protein